MKRNAAAEIETVIEEEAKRMKALLKTEKNMCLLQMLLHIKMLRCS
jgi:hypothetical protein